MRVSFLLQEKMSEKSETILSEKMSEKRSHGKTQEGEFVGNQTKMQKITRKVGTNVRAKRIREK